ncbi:hypothetical protein ElyMa_001147600 [Elysia marginata]|uniref:Uncharacterized protein n=1 Tax=Elysia marginata TaxID=1093978 RepID=A0AAV4I2I6_9GAST|nr:hypothetical protein ElyMa_001147600 [Elysia marginata]
MQSIKEVDWAILRSSLCKFKVASLLTGNQSVQFTYLSMITHEIYTSHTSAAYNTLHHLKSSTHHTPQQPITHCIISRALHITHLSSL